MTVWMRKWLLGIVAAALAGAAADSLVSQKAMKQLVHLAGGILLTLAMLRPLAALVPAELPLARYKEQAEEIVSASQAEQNSTLSALIEAELAAYIVDKAAGMGLETQARVEVSGERIAVYLTIPRDEALSVWLEEALGTAPSDQFWQAS